jgi:carboxyl-terminal processing protease
MTRKETLAYATLTLGSVVLAFLAGYLTRGYFPASGSRFPILTEARDALARYGIEPIADERALEYGMIRGMVEAYGDPFTSFSEPARHELQTNDLSGSYGGIGVRLDRDAAGAYILYPFPDSPAAQAGILPADILLRVDDLNIASGTPEETVTAAIRGSVGSTVQIEVARPPELARFDYEIERAEVPLPSVTWRLAPGDNRIGLVEVNLIAASTPAEIERAAADLQAQGAVAFVLDVRGNGGGLLDAGVDCARLFLTDGVVIEQQYRGEEINSFDVEAPGSLAHLPLVVWVDHGTASAAEILAGALQSHGRAVLIGAPTFGKDVIQLVFELSDNSSIQVSAARWWFPGFAFPNGEAGLVPDLETGDYLAATVIYLFGAGD